MSVMNIMINDVMTLHVPFKELCNTFGFFFVTHVFFCVYACVCGLTPQSTIFQSFRDEATCSIGN